jgi:hypothetical protein
VVYRLQGRVLAGEPSYCCPLTITDHASRYLLTCETLSSTREDFAARDEHRFHSITQELVLLVIFAPARTM